MKAKTRLFGEIEIDESKIITFINGMVGFPDMKKFTILYDNEKEGKGNIMWFQSLDEPSFAMPVMQPNVIMPDYNPIVNDELISPLGEFTEDNLYVLVTVTVPSDITKMTANMKGPIIINTDTLLASQIVVENDMQVRFPIYELCKARKEKKAGKEDMLALTRKKGESTMINYDIEISILEIRGDQIKIGISAPKDVPVYRKEVYNQIKEETKEAVDAEALTALKDLF